MRVKHSAIIRHGKLRLDDKARFDKEMQGFKDGTKVYFVVKPEEPTIDDNLRGHYFAQVMTLISEETGILDKETIHMNMKIKFSSHVDERTGLTVVHSVFSDDSLLPVSAKRKFIQKVKQWGYDFLNIRFPVKGEAEDDHGQ